ncbi:putative UPF0496 protein 5 [Oryza brachyantha]|uniref:putative UPF0496 protein 5 n=1 Tax=Oryza brachyantha TaxID=4533 RepID=UPI001ADC96FD|nr:putative UPF0496 protein 5 [Oryza brachyantha]
MGNRYSALRPRRLVSSRRSEAAAAMGEEEEEPGSYEAACSGDPELRTFDTELRRRASHAITAVASGVEVRSMSLGSLREVTGCLVDMNQEVVRVLLDCKRDVWRSPDLFDLVEDYFEVSLDTLDFLAALDNSLHRARDSQLILHLALQRHRNAAPAPELYASTLAELRQFKAAGDPFTDEFFAAFQTVYRQQTAMVAKLQQRKRRLDRSLRSVRVWRRVSSIVFLTTFAALLVCSVVAAAIAAPPVAAALAAAASMPVGSAGKWMDSLLKKYQDALQGHKEVVSAMQVGTFIAIKDLDSIRAVVDHLEVQISSMVDCVEFAERDEETAKFVIEEVKKKLEVFMKSVDELGEQADRCSRDIRKARTVVLQRIIHHPSN